MSDYSKIIDHPHYQSKTRPHMSMLNRAAQFAPFAALSGYDEAVAETHRLTSERVILDESTIEELDAKLQYIGSNMSDAPAITITYYVPDERKNGGVYIPVTGKVVKIDTYHHKLLMSNGTSVPIGDIVDIDGIDI